MRARQSKAAGERTCAPPRLSAWGYGNILGKLRPRLDGGSRSAVRSGDQLFQKLKGLLQLGVRLVGLKPLPHAAADVRVQDLLIHPL